MSNPISPAVIEALQALGIRETAIAAMRGQWPAGFHHNPSKWSTHEKQCLPIFAENCLQSDWQEWRELDDLDFIEWQAEYARALAESDE